MIDAERTRALRKQMVTGLVDSGVITEDAWRQVFTAVPRHALVPRFYRSTDRAVIDSANPDDKPAWLEAVYSNKTLVTQITPTDVTSSATMPGLLAKMLTALRTVSGDKRPAHRYRHRLHGRAALRAPWFEQGHHRRHRP